MTSPTCSEPKKNQDQARPVLRPGEEQVLVWLSEFTRLRDAAAARTSAQDEAMQEAKERIARHFTGLVESVARRFTHSGEPLDDLVQEGYLGLLSALDSYSPSKGAKFSTYATHFVAGAMRHCLRDRGKIIKEPAWLQEVSGKVARTTDALTQSLGRAPHAGEVAAALNLTEEAVEEILSTRQIFQVASFQTDPDTNAAGLVDPEKIRSDKYVTLQLPIEDRIVLEGAVEKLKALEQKVLYEFFYKDLNQTEIARKFGISCNYVSHILKNSTKKLRRILGEAEVRERGRVRVSSVQDALTGLYTPAHVQGRLEEELSRASRGGHPFAVIAAEVRNLPADGARREEIVSACGAALRASIRRVDMAGRLAPEGGAESFLILLPHTGAQAQVVADRIKDTLGALSAKESEPFAVRVGHAHFPEQGRSARALLTVARRDDVLSAAA